jgi:hypothetical protein
MNKKLLPILFIVTLLGLLLFQKDVVLPFAEWVASTDLFLENSEDKGSRIANSTPMTSHAFNQCNIEIKNTFNDDISINFPHSALQSWSLGNYKYIINADIELTKASGESFLKKYACQIQYNEDSDLSGVMNSDNWDVLGLSGLSSL